MPDARPPRRERETAESAVGKALAIMTAFSYTEPVLGISELGRRLGLPKSTVHRLVASLVTGGFMERTKDDRYRLSLRIYEMGQQVVSSHGLRQVAHLPLERLRNETGEASHLAVLSGPDVVYLDRFESPHLMRLLNRVGSRNAAHGTSSGKCLLAFGTHADVACVVAAGLERLGPRTITSKSRLTQCLAEVRKQGYAVSVDESAPGITSIAAPVFDHTGTCVASVSLVGPSTRLPQESADRHVRLVVRAAAEISKALVRSPLA